MPRGAGGRRTQLVAAFAGDGLTSCHTNATGVPARKTWQLDATVLENVSVPALENVRVFRSPLHGYGVLARRDIPAGEVIAEVEGVLYRREELGDDTYCLWIDGEYFLDMVDQTRWINHSCDPNAEVEADLDGNGGAWARIIAIRPIKAGEEITYHYLFSEDVAEPCNCGTPPCNGWIIDPDELPALERRLAKQQRAALAAAR